MGKVPYYDLWLTNKERIIGKVEKLKKEYDNFKRRNKKLENDFLYKEYNQRRTITVMKKIRKKQEKIIRKLIREYSNIFKIIPCVIFLSGSLARESNRINSDVDLTFLYPEDFFKSLNPIEEEIAVFLSYIFGYKGRDKVHTMTIYLNIEDKNLQEYDSNIKFINYDKNIKIKYRENYEELLYQINNSKRDYEEFEMYLKNNIKSNKCEEWIYNFKIIYLSYKKYDICKLISKLDYNLIIEKKKKIYIICSIIF